VGGEDDEDEESVDESLEDEVVVEERGAVVPL
jgi:hypothetical protein